MDFLFVGDHPAIDFVNTRPVVGGRPIELLAEDADVVRWLAAAGLELPAALAALAGPIVALFTETDPARTRRCANPDCVLWFLDVTKGGRRRWHEMETCGNAQKARRFRERHRTDGPASR